MSSLLLGVRELNPRAKRFISKATSLMLVYVFAIMLTNTFLILHALDFVSLSQLAIILAVQFTVQALADYPSGAIGDMVGQRWVLFIAALSFGTGFILLSLAYDFLSILIAFIMIAFAQSQESGAFMSWFDNNYKLYAFEDVNRRTYSQFYGRFTMFYELATAASFTLGGALMIFISRQYMFIIQGALVFLVSIMFLFFMRDHEALKREKKGFRKLFQYLRGGIASTAQNKTLRLMILGLVISGVGFTIWSGLILFPLYANYAKSDAGTAILRAIIFVTGAIGAGIAGVVSKRIHKLQRWLSLAVLITDATFFIGIYVMMAFNPVPPDFSLISIILVILTFAIAFSPRYLADVLKPRFYLDVIPDQSRNAVYSLIPTLILIASIPVVPFAGIMIEVIGVETMVLILSVNGLVGSSITAYAIYRHRVEKELEEAAIDLCCPIFPSKMTDTQTIIPLTIPCCWSFDPVSQYIWSQLQESALRDKIITEEEKELIDIIMLNVQAYGTLLEESMNSGRIDKDEQKRLVDAREKIWIEAHNIAAGSAELSEDAQETLSTLTQLLKYLDIKRVFRV